MIKKKVEEESTITCLINNELSIILKNVMKTYGHVDSLPFKADLYIQSKKMGFTEPTSLFTYISVTRTVSLRSSFLTSSGFTFPSPSTGR